MDKQQAILAMTEILTDNTNLLSQEVTKDMKNELLINSLKASIAALRDMLEKIQSDKLQLNKLKTYEYWVKEAKGLAGLATISQLIRKR